MTLTRTRRGNFDVWSDGTILPVVRGGSEQGTGDAPPPNPPPPAPPADEKVTRTKAEDDAHAKGIRVEAERNAKKAAEKAIADSLGVSIEDAKKIIADQKAAAEEAKTETQKAVDAAKAREDAATARETAAAAKERQTDAKAALLAAGIKLPEKAEDRAKKLSRATSLLLAEAGDDADEAAISAAAETLKAEMPELFGAPAGGIGAPSGDPSGGPKPGGAGQKTGIEAGRERARAANGTADKPNPLDGLRVVGSR